MDPDDGADAASIRRMISLHLIKAISVGILGALDGWHEENGIVEYDLTDATVAIMAAAAASIEMLGAGPDAGESIQ